MKYFLGLAFLLLTGSGLLARTASAGDSPHPASAATSGTSTAAGSDKKNAEAEQAPAGPTIIDSNNMDYDEKTRIAIFTGEDYGVYVQDPRFTVYCDKLTAHMKKGAGTTAATGTSPAATPVKPTPAPSAGPKGKAAAAAADAPSTGTGGLESALAEGNTDRPVVIVQDKPAANGEAAQHNVGIALKADYNADSGDMKLTGWPRVSQGINTQIATASYTVMYMNKEGKTMRTVGPSRTVIREQAQPKTTGTNSPAQSPSPSPQ